MKTFMVAAICFLVIIASLFIYVNFVDEASDDFISDLEDVEEEVLEENWEKAERELASFNEEWEKEKKLFGIFMDQTETEKISEQISLLKTYINSRDKAEALAKISSIKVLIEQISHTEKPTIINILKAYGSKKEIFS